MLWNPTIKTAGAAVGVGPSGFRFSISGTPDTPVTVEGSSQVAGGMWEVLLAGKLIDGSLVFSDPDWTKHSARFYRIRWP